MTARRRFAFGIALISAGLSGAGLVAALTVRSPQQLLADTAPPPATRLTATVQRRVLTSTVVTRGSVVARTTLEVTPVVAGVGAQVVTAVGVRSGDEIRAGQVLVAVSGRPLIALPGAIPAYRDLKPGDRGDDVRALQGALAGLGHPTGPDPAGVFGPGTNAAVRALYAKLGYDPPGAGGPADRAAATMLPLAEFVFVPTFPARVTAFTARVGDPVRAPLLTLAAGDLSVQVRLRPDQAALITPGVPVRLLAEALGQELPGTVGTIGELTPDADRGGGAGSGAPYRPATVTAAAPIPTGWGGLDVRVTISSARTADPVLVVPLSAVSAGADGRTTVTVVGTGDRLTPVEVRAGASGDGFVEVTPVSGGLAEGDRVVVGSAA